MSDAPYELVLTPPATRAIQSGLPEGVATAVIELLTGALVENPHRVGKQLREDLAGIYSARRGTYRVLYRINEVQREVVVLRIARPRVTGRAGRDLGGTDGVAGIREMVIAGLYRDLCGPRREDRV